MIHGSITISVVLWIFSAFVAFAPEANAAEDWIEKDFPVRHQGDLVLLNLRGSVKVKGWTLDKIRVRARRLSVDPADSVSLTTADVRFRESSKLLELSAEFGKGLDLQQRLAERAAPRVKMDWEVFAPAGLPIRLSVASGLAALQGWSADVEIRSTGGEIRVENVKAKQVSLFCPECAIALRQVRGVVRCVGGTGNVSWNQVSGSSLYGEVTQGELFTQGVSGEQLYVSRDGAIRSIRGSGRLEFRSNAGRIDISGFRGFASGSTTSGPIAMRVSEWNFEERAFLESKSGEIRLVLPEAFAGELDVWSVTGRTAVEFKGVPIRERGEIGPQPSNRLRSIIGKGGELLRVHSFSGDVAVLRGGSEKK